MPHNLRFCSNRYPSHCRAGLTTYWLTGPDDQVTRLPWCEDALIWRINSVWNRRTDPQNRSVDAGTIPSGRIESLIVNLQSFVLVASRPAARHDHLSGIGKMDSARRWNDAGDRQVHHLYPPASVRETPRGHPCDRVLAMRLAVGSSTYMIALAMNAGDVCYPRKHPRGQLFPMRAGQHPSAPRVTDQVAWSGKLLNIRRSVIKVRASSPRCRRPQQAAVGISAIDDGTTRAGAEARADVAVGCKRNCQVRLPLTVPSAPSLATRARTLRAHQLRLNRVTAPAAPRSHRYPQRQRQPSNAPAASDAPAAPATAGPTEPITPAAPQFSLLQQPRGWRTSADAASR